jgi:sugar/nucleoside kinase (ribokinase family)
MDEGIEVDTSADTSYSIVINYPGVDRIFLHYAGANDSFQSSDIPYSILDQARLFHFGYPPVMRSLFSDGGAQLTEIFRLAKRTGVTTSMDMAFPDSSSEAGQVDWRFILGNTLPFVDIFLPSVEEILFMLRGETYRELRQTSAGSDILPLITPQLLSDLGSELIDMGAKIVGLKMGDRGMYLRTSNRDGIASIGRTRPSDPETWSGVELWTPCFKVVVAGTTGSGDATNAGLLAGLLRDLPVEQALTMAVAVGACNVEAPDALSGIRSWEETSRRTADGWERKSLILDTPGWQFDQLSGLWRGPCV